MKNLIFYFFLTLLLPFQQLSAQELWDAPPILYKNHFTVGLGLHNHGWMLTGRYGIHKSVERNIIFESDLARIRHPKEVRLVNPQFDNNKPFVFGKDNDFYNLRLGVGYQKMIFEKGEKNGLEIRYTLSGGLSSGLLKPVYYDILVRNSAGSGGFSINQERFDPEKHSEEAIAGGAKWEKGLDELSYLPGVYGKIGILFEWSNYDEDLKQVEAGFILDAFPKNVPIFVVGNNQRLFANFYIAFQLGRRW